MTEHQANVEEVSGKMESVEGEASKEMEEGIAGLNTGNLMVRMQEHSLSSLTYLLLSSTNYG